LVKENNASYSLMLISCKNKE